MMSLDSKIDVESLMLLSETKERVQHPGRSSHRISGMGNMIWSKAGDSGL